MAFGQSTFSDAGGAVSDLFASFGHEAKAKGDEFEKQNYELAATYADENAAYTESATKIKEAQQDRALFQGIGRTTADIGGAGFAQSGSALDILRDSAQQGSLTKAVLTSQGAITEAGYKEQADSYRNMAQAAQVAIDAEHTAGIGSLLTGGIKGAASIATLFAL
jgi:hypothetical protein